MIDTSRRAVLDAIETRLRDHMSGAPKRLRHVLGVSQTAAELARIYGVDEFEACAAGLLHDWDKVLTPDETLARAAELGVSLDGPADRVVGLLHGPLAARELPALFPELPAAVFQAVDRHTVGAIDMMPLDMVVFIADAIEPGRVGAYADELRAQVGKVTLDELFFSCFSHGITYVVSTGRYLYPTAVDIYNTYAIRRTLSER